jgi:uncharacterized protein (TIGR02677 family)
MTAELAELADDDGGGDPWSVHLPGRELVPAYLVSRFAAQYRAIVDVLLAEQDSSLVGLSFDEIRAAVGAHLARRLPAEVADALMDPVYLPLDDRLERLERWQVVTRWQEPARTGEDFLRRRDRYQLTPLAARLHAFWSQAGDEDDEAGGDLTLAPRAIHDRLRAFGAAIAAGGYPAAAAEFQQIGALHQAMGRSARAWQRTLAHALSGGPDHGKQELLWRTLRSYIGMWGEQVDVHSPRIAELMAELDGRLTPALWRACARSALAEATEELVASQAQRWARTWEALGHWFGGADGQARRLRRQLRDLVAPWARNMHILMDAGGVVTRRAELLRLAVAIERAPDEDAAWRAWDTAVGIFAARHLLLPSDTPDDHAVPWQSAPAAPVTARFREHGARAAVGRRPNPTDFSAGRAAARQARMAGLAARGEAEASLRQRSGTSIASWEPVGEAELDLMLEFLGAASRADGGTGSQPRSTITADGRWRVTFTPPVSPSDTATVRCPSGALVTPNWRFDMAPA